MDMNETTPRGVPTLQFNPDNHPHATLKAFQDFIEQYEFRYNAQYPQPSKYIFDTAVEFWKVDHGNTEPTATEKKTIRDDIRSKDKVRKLLGFFATNRLQQDWKAAEGLPADREDSTWENFTAKMVAYYKPSENTTLRNYEFRQLVQEPSETFSAFCNRVEKEGKTCTFCSCAATSTCNATEMAVRDQIVIGTHMEKIKQQALMKSWDLAALRTNGMKLESVSRGEERISHASVSKVGNYSYKTIEKRKSDGKLPHTEKSQKHCYRCGEVFSSWHLGKCKAKKAKCSKCSKIGHFSKVCSQKDVKAVNSESEEDHDENDGEVLSLNIWRIKSSQNTPRYAHKNHDFKSRVMVNNKLVTLLADTGAKVSVCGMKQAARWGILDKMRPSRVKIYPYNSEPITVRGIATCAATFHDTSVPVDFHILPGSCEPILAGNKALQLKIISFNNKEQPFNPVLMIETDKESGKKLRNDINYVLQQYPQNFTGLGKLKNHQVKLYVDKSVKPVAVPPRPIPYHLRSRVNDALATMEKEGVIEEHPTGEAAPWVSCAVIVPKTDGSIRVTMDARNVNKAVQSNNHPIPRQADIKAQLAGAKYFSKLDFKSAFWQLELHPESRNLTVFHGVDKLYRYTRLLMGVKSAQGDLNTALKPVFAHIPDVHLIHDDLVIASKTKEEHISAISAVMNAISDANLTLNPSKCIFGKNEVKFWGMIFSAEGVRPDPGKVEALEGLSPPGNKDDLKSFICMMQSNSEFIPGFAKLIAPLRELLKPNCRYKWKEIHQKTFTDVLLAFKKDALLHYFDLSKKTFVFVDAHNTGLGAILAQGESVETARPIEFAARSTNKAEGNYPQVDLEAMSVDYSLRRFRQYLVGAPHKAIIVTDHQPLLSIFNGNRGGSIRTERIKMRHQNIQYQLQYRKGSENITDYLSRHAKPWNTLPKDIKEEADDLNNLLFTLRVSPILDALGIKEIAMETKKDVSLSKLQKLIKSGKTYVPKDDQDLAPFKKILHQITYLANGTLFFEDRIILPASLHNKAIRLAHLGSHPGQNGLARRLRSHFYILHLDEQLKRFVETCLDCQSFTNKTTKEPIQPNKVPEKCWQEVSVDLFGPLPTSNHIVVIQDLASRFPIGKIVSSTSSKKVIPVLSEAYDTFGNPDVQKSDNGPPFNSNAMADFTESRDIEQVKIAPGHPAANNVETLMKPLGKAMKIGLSQNKTEETTLQSFLTTYRDTPHPSTRTSPGSMLFRDGYKANMPRKTLDAKAVTIAREHDIQNKEARKEQYNASRHTKNAEFQIGNQVLVKNFYKKSKFEPVFLPERYLVVDTMANGKIILVKSLRSGRHLRRHPNDVKLYEGSFPDSPENPSSEGEILLAWREAFASLDVTEDGMDDTIIPPLTNNNNNNEIDHVRRPVRERRQNPRYFNENFDTT